MFLATEAASCFKPKHLNFGKKFYLPWSASTTLREAEQRQVCEVQLDLQWTKPLWGTWRGGHPIFRNLETHCSASFISTSVFIAYYDVLSNDVFSLVRLLRGTNLPFFLERGFQTPLSPCDFPPMSRPTLSHKGATETIFSSCLISQLMFSRDFPNWINTTHINTKLPC